MTRAKSISPGTAADHPDPYPFYADLVAGRPFDRHDGSGHWVAAAATAVTEVLTDPVCRVRPAAEPVPRGLLDTAAGQVYGGLVRMTDGPTQARRKEILRAALATISADRVVALAAEQADRATDWTDCQFGVPARVVATLLGLGPGLPAEAARLTGRFVRCIPASADADDQIAAAAAAARLLDLLGPARHADRGGLLGEFSRRADPDDRAEQAALLANAVGLLSQTYDATAGLVGNTLLARARHGRPDDLGAFVAEVARHDAPIQNTRRFVAADTTLGGQRLPAGAVILLLLAAANRDPAANPDPAAFRTDRADPRVFTFGLGAHHCPGRLIATAIATGVAAVRTESPAHEGYHPSANARIPALRGPLR